MMFGEHESGVTWIEAIVEGIEFKVREGLTRRMEGTTVAIKYFYFHFSCLVSPPML